jgi:hypothetical protein
VTSIDGELLDELEEILAGRGREDAVTSAALSDRLEMHDGEASPKTREAIRILRRERGLPVRAGNVGYWVCQSEQEADEYIEQLRSRMSGIERTLQEFNAAWDGHRDDPDLPDDIRARVDEDPALTMSDVIDHYGGSGVDG